MAATDARPVPIKNTAFRAYFPILDADGDLVTGAAALDSEVSIDGAAFADVTAEATEIATSSGMYFLDLTAAEMNGDCIAVIVKTSTAGAKTTVLVFYPEEAGDINVDVTAFGGTAGTFSAGRPEVNTSHVAGTAQTAGDIMGDTNDIQTRLPAALVGGRMDSSIGAVAANAITAAGIADGAIDAATFAAGAIDAAAIAADAIGASELAASAVDEIWDEAMAELAQAAPSATPSMRALLALLYMVARNAVTVTSSSKTFSNDAGTVVFKKALSDDGTTYTEGEMATGP